MTQLSLLPNPLPPGFSYQTDFVAAEEEKYLLEKMASLSWRPYVYGEYVAHRKIAAYGMDDKIKQGHHEKKIPEFIVPFRQRMARHFGVDENKLVATLFTHYPKGAAIGWHSDSPIYGTVLGLSLLSGCIMDFRLKQEGQYDECHVPLEARSAYKMIGPARYPWQHRIGAAKQERFSITFRTLKN